MIPESFKKAMSKSCTLKWIVNRPKSLSYSKAAEQVLSGGSLSLAAGVRGIVGEVDIPMANKASPNPMKGVGLGIGSTGVSVGGSTKLFSPTEFFKEIVDENKGKK